MELFSRLHEQGMTIVMVTHSMEVASYATRQIRMSDGEIIE